jgi:hypothetical protein
MKKYISFIATAATIFLAHLLPFSWLVGSAGSFFSWSTMVSPVIAQHMGFAWLTIFILFSKKLTWATLAISCLKRLPLFAAGWVYTCTSWFGYIFLPLVCMTLFIAHPVGSQAALYTSYWFIPVALYFGPRNLYTRALAAVFVAHALGSVIWLYTGTISADTWNSLIPVVAWERLFMACGIVFCEFIFLCFAQACRTVARRMKVMGWS